MTLKNLTRTDIDRALDAILSEGIEHACARTGGRPGRFVVRTGGTTKDTATDIPTKVLLAVAAGCTCREFSGGFARTVGILTRLGIDVTDTRTGRLANPDHDGRTTKARRKDTD